MAKNEPFRLERVWTVRRLEALARLGEWSRWQARADQARQEASQLEHQRRQAAGDLIAAGARTALEMAALWRQVEHLGRRQEAAAGRAEVLEREAAARRQVALEARREEQAYQRLFDRHQARQRQEAVRREQAQIDEVAGRRPVGEGGPEHGIR
ncbi:flagellar export protein FliJ [Thermaerobacter litoralis]